MKLSTIHWHVVSDSSKKLVNTNKRQTVNLIKNNALTFRKCILCGYLFPTI